MIRNNVIYADVPYFDTGVELSQASGTKVFHNTIPHNDAVTSLFSSIDYRFPNTSVVVKNNLVERITVREGANGTVDHNLQDVPLGYFVNPAGYDFHITSGATDAINAGVEVARAGRDMDGQRHKSGAPDLGADERT
jgi:hypothetical protein